jgi:N-acetylneuraminic acid mutarotase
MSKPTRTLAAIFVSVTLASCGNDATVVSEGWSAGPSLPMPKFEAYAATDGARIYFLGGIIGEGTDPAFADPSARVHVLEPGSNAWTEGPLLPSESAKHHLAVAAVGADIFVLGGFDGILGKRNDGFRPIATTYVLRGGSWQRLADAPLARGGATAQAIDGRIYVVGGAPTEDQDPYSDLYVYDPASNTWTKKAPIPTPREHLASCNLGGRMLVLGGWNKRNSVKLAELYDPQTDTWSRVADMPTTRGGLAATALGNVCHVIGGEDWALPYPGTFTVNEGYDLQSGTWKQYAQLPQARHGIGLVNLKNELWVVGGGPGLGNSYTARVDRYTRPL